LVVFEHKDARIEDFSTVSYLDNIFGPAASRYGRALDAASERQSLLMKNLSNVNTPGYKRQDSDFHITLENEMTGNDSELRESAMRKRRQDQSSLRVDGNNVDLEREVMSIAETETRYNALTDFTARYFSGLKSVIREGR
jgi:flagellar basal-body rod protein FlgB